MWGNLTNWMECTFGVRFKGHEEIEMARLSRIGIVTTLKTHDLHSSRTYERIVNSIEDWWSYAGSWIQVFAAKHVVSLRPRRQEGDGVGLTLWEDGKILEGKRGPSGSPEWFSIPVTNDELAASLRLAGQRTSPPLEWMLIRDAQYLVRTHEYRRAIIDAGTAAELAITRMIDRKLTGQGQTQSQIETLLARGANRTLGGRMNLLDRVNAGRLPPRFYDIVVAQRNAAAHEGAQFRRIDAERAVLKTRRLVEKAANLDGYLR